MLNINMLTVLFLLVCGSVTRAIQPPVACSNGSNNRFGKSLGSPYPPRSCQTRAASQAARSTDSQQLDSWCDEPGSDYPWLEIQQFLQSSSETVRQKLQTFTDNNVIYLQKKYGHTVEDIRHWRSRRSAKISSSHRGAAVGDLLQSRRRTPEDVEEVVKEDVVKKVVNDMVKEEELKAVTAETSGGTTEQSELVFSTPDGSGSRPDGDTGDEVDQQVSREQEDEEKLAILSDTQSADSSGAVITIGTPEQVITSHGEADEDAAGTSGKTISEAVANSETTENRTRTEEVTELEENITVSPKAQKETNQTHTSDEQKQTTEASSSITSSTTEAFSSITSSTTDSSTSPPKATTEDVVERTDHDLGTKTIPVVRIESRVPMTASSREEIYAEVQYYRPKHSSSSSSGHGASAASDIAVDQENGPSAQRLVLRPPSVQEFNRKTTVFSVKFPSASTSESTPSQLGNMTEVVYVSSSTSHRPPDQQTPSGRPTASGPTTTSTPSTTTSTSTTTTTVSTSTRQPASTYDPYVRPACASMIELRSPFYALNTQQVWKTLINMPPFETSVHMEHCDEEGVQGGCASNCRCKQRYTMRTMPVYDRDENGCDTIYMDKFMFPSHCDCMCLPGSYLTAFRPTTAAPTSTEPQQQRQAVTVPPRQAETVPPRVPIVPPQQAETVPPRVPIVPPEDALSTHRNRNRGPAFSPLPRYSVATQRNSRHINLLAADQPLPQATPR